jgi:hypothetical protein
MFAGIAIEYALCLAVSFYFNDENEYWYAFLIMLALWAIQIVLALKVLLVGSIYYHLFGKRQAVEYIENKMMEADLPYYGDDMDHAEYIRTILSDEQATAGQIRFAAESAGIIDTMKGQSFVKGWRMMKTYDMALKNYLRKRGAWERQYAHRMAGQKGPEHY